MLTKINSAVQFMTSNYAYFTFRLMRNDRMECEEMVYRLFHFILSLSSRQTLSVVPWFFFNQHKNLLLNIIFLFRSSTCTLQNMMVGDNTGLLLTTPRCFRCYFLNLSRWGCLDLNAHQLHLDSPFRCWLVRFYFISIVGNGFSQYSRAIQHR